MGEQPLESGEVARRAAEIASDKQAADIVMLDIRGLCTFADYFVICTGDTTRQVQAIAEELDMVLGKTGAHLLRQEGTVDSGWVLMDFGDVIIHLFSPREREYYALERLWRSAVPILRFQ